MTKPDSVHQVALAAESPEAGRSSTAALDDLITRLEKATGSYRELDADVFIATELSPELERDRIDKLGGVVGWKPKNAPYQSAREVPRYTTSIDAALTLVPEGHGLLMATGRFCKATVSVGYLGDFDAKWTGDANAPTLPLALCIAALRARAAIARAKGDA